MIFIVRCVSCNKVLNSRYEAYLKVLQEERAKQGLSSEVLITSTTTPEDIRALCTSKLTPESIAMARVGIRRACCRRHFLSDVDIVESNFM